MVIQMPFLFAYYSMLGAALICAMPLALDSGFVVIRSVASVADRDYHHHAAYPAHDAPAGNGPVAAEDDDPDDALMLGVIS